MPQFTVNVSWGRGFDNVKTCHALSTIQTHVKTNGSVTEILTYDKLNRLTASNTSTYTYRADGLRNSKTVSGTTTTHVWSGNHIWADLTSSSSRRYIWGINLIYNISGSTRTFYM